MLSSHLESESRQHFCPPLRVSYRKSCIHTGRYLHLHPDFQSPTGFKLSNGGATGPASCSLNPMGTLEGKEWRHGGIASTSSVKRTWPEGSTQVSERYPQSDRSGWRRSYCYPRTFQDPKTLFTQLTVTHHSLMRLCLLSLQHQFSSGC